MRSRPQSRGVVTAASVSDARQSGPNSVWRVRLVDSAQGPSSRLRLDTCQSEASMLSAVASCCKAVSNNFSSIFKEFPAFGWQAFAPSL